MVKYIVNSGMLSYASLTFALFIQFFRLWQLYAAADISLLKLCKSAHFNNIILQSDSSIILIVEVGT